MYHHAAAVEAVSHKERETKVEKAPALVSALSSNVIQTCSVCVCVCVCWLGGQLYKDLVKPVYTTICIAYYQ